MLKNFPITNSRKMTRLLSMSMIFMLMISLLTFMTFAEDTSIDSDKDSYKTGLVGCGFDSKIGEACHISDFFDTADRFGQFIIKVIFPALFFIGLVTSVWPLVQDPTNPEKRAAFRKKFAIILWGTLFVVGAYLVIGVLLKSIGATSNTVINKTILDNSGGASDSPATGQTQAETQDTADSPATKE